MSTMIITWQQINNIYYVFFEFLRKAIEKELAKYKNSKYEGINISPRSALSGQK
jgi:hypothetical protein